MKVLDLFSGIGGFSLGLERTGGFRTIAFCEIEQWCQRVLAKHWLSVPQLGDITTIGVEPMSSSEDFLARTSVSPGEAPALPASVPLSGGGYAEPFAWYDRNTQSWRTWQRCLIEGWTRYAETWPRSGMTRSGIAYRLPTLAPLTNETESGSWPTPTAAMGERGGRGDLLAWVRGYENKHYPRKWPTPTSRDYKDGSAQACANVPHNGLLGRVVHLWPTPRVQSGGGVSCTMEAARTQVERHGYKGRIEEAVALKSPSATGSLNPMWVEWLMGYPLGWTDLKDSATPWSRKSRKSSVKPC